MVNLVRYHGVLAPAARHRSAVIPEGPDTGCAETPVTSRPETATKKRRLRSRNYSWAELLHRVFELDVLACPECGGRMRILAAIHPPDAIQDILECLELPARAPPISPADPDDSLFDPFEAC